MAKRTILGVFAHPDDEILGPGGTLARYASEGVDVTLVVATRGEAGEIQRPGAATPETLPQVREQEMLCSAAALGVSEVIFLDYRDSGMDGAPDNQHLRAFINAPDDEVVSRLVGIIRRFRPQVVLTFEPYGGYGHPDHIAANRHTLAAFQAAGDSACFPQSGPAWQPHRLFYPVLPHTLFEKLKRRIKAHGGDASGFDETIAQRREHGWPAEKIHTVLDVSPFVSQKREALRCHRTQFGPRSRFRRLPEEAMVDLLSREYFALAAPAPPPGYHLADLFAGLD